MLGALWGTSPLPISSHPSFSSHVRPHLTRVSEGAAHGDSGAYNVPSMIGGTQ